MNKNIIFALVFLFGACTASKPARKVMTKAEAEAYLTEMDNVELDNAVLDKVAGGGCYSDLSGPWDT